jgi:hypothetical protein
MKVSDYVKNGQVDIEKLEKLIEEVEILRGEFYYVIPEGYSSWGGGSLNTYGAYKKKSSKDQVIKAAGNKIREQFKIINTLNERIRKYEESFWYKQYKRFKK